MSQTSGFLKPVSFATCSYVKKRPSARADMVFGAISTWSGLLDLPFAEKIFLDDRSPDFAALRVLQSTELLNKFTRAEYCTTKHPLHCNFGFVGCTQLATSPYILHLDDDVYVNGTPEDCRQAIDNAIRVMEEHPS